MVEENRQLDPKRVRIQEKIIELEKKGIFYQDVEDDPETIPLEPEMIDYLKKGFMDKVYNKFAYYQAIRFFDKSVAAKKVIIKEVIGIENARLDSGAIVTCNHFNPYDSFSVEKSMRDAGILKKRKLYKVIREGNYTNFPGFFGFIFKYCNTLPLSSVKETMKKFLRASEILLKRGDYILIYPEQSMWWNYRKPKPLKPGAFSIAAKNGVPVIPVFITMNDSDIIGDDGYLIQEYTIHIEKPIYPDSKKSNKENEKIMMEKNFQVWKKVYEDFYNIPLTYLCDEVGKNEEK